MKSKDTCEIYCYNQEKVNQVQNKIENVDISSVSRLFKAIADDNRAKITYALCQEEELCVCDLANIIGAPVANTSHHLRLLHKQGIVKFRKQGKLAFYSINNPDIKQLIKIGLAFGKEVKVDA
ncbi:ArsR/SmtB family transcription factor [Aquibacillus rhizosphaerae]|uniref:Metalloregulator ArsR/SmtB family transcription factor n=1 Tax=Aquibacillus rhizosphaerae TaxID=3051431 RepID=A0ABT7LE82_9BACI|nr:metalloregulator ArsR/SmtB family transcription factor [Aquibacillus sp. LR5S19]MDL4842890.1 metalloregulator ArsR/SmtB family transcription factor [Aquibacillus sp. LR5S19]